MKVFIFLGPTLSIQEARLELDAHYLPPVAQGDVYRVSLEQPQAIGIIDGYFDQRPAVLHKEILWAMQQGVHVYGSASMGALRAVELASFGMEGVGKIFEDYRDGIIEDEDEVAVTHGSAETGYRTSSEAMVNIRSTLNTVAATGLLSTTTCTEIERIAKTLFYADRAYPKILKLAAKQGLPQIELDILKDWLSKGQVNQKRQDALAMLRRIRDELPVMLKPKRVSFTLEHTSYWNKAIQYFEENQTSSQDEIQMPIADLVLEELRLQGAAYSISYQEAKVRHLLIQELQRQGYTLDTNLVDEIAERFYQLHHLSHPSDIETWLEENDLTYRQIERLFQEEVLLKLAPHFIERQVLRRLPNYLRITGQYKRLKMRALEKQRVLKGQNFQELSLEKAGLTTEELLRWYFTSLNQPLPKNLKHYVHFAGFTDEETFIQAILKEFFYQSADTGLLVRDS